MSDAGADYTAENKAEREQLAAEQLAVDLQEAASIRYVTGIRLAILSSGNFAIFSGGPQGLSEIEIVHNLDPDVLRSLAVEARERMEKSAEAEYTNSSTQAATTILQKSLEDMDL